jgi:hypothetical protein
MRLINKFATNAVFAGVLAGSALLAALPAKANTYDVTFNGSSFDVSAVITTADTLDSVGGYDILGISGIVTGPTSSVSGAINNLISNPGQPNQGTYYVPGTSIGWYYDNVLFPSGSAFDNNGPLFSFGAGIVANLYSVGSTFYLSLSQPSGFWNPGDSGSLQVAQTPLPAALPLFASGLAAMGLIGWRRKRKKAAALAAVAG